MTRPFNGQKPDVLKCWKMNRSHRRFGYLLAGCLFWQYGMAQGPQWWSDNVDWDGVTPFEHYLELTPTGMGPNALPVPDLHGQNDSTTSFTLSGAASFRSGETTLHSAMDLRWQATPEIRLRVHLVPLEWYHTNHELKTRRKIHFLSYDQQWAGGDIYVETIIRIPKRWIPVYSEFRVGLKTASGTNLGAARYTDTPGYFFDLSSAGRIAGQPALEWELMAGFYAYQTYDNQHRQNDCILYGASLGWRSPKWSLRGELRGYRGYFKLHDRPLVAAVEGRLGSFQDNWQLILRGEQGLYDWPYSSIHVGVRRLLLP